MLVFKKTIRRRCVLCREAAAQAKDQQQVQQGLITGEFLSITGIDEWQRLSVLNLFVGLSAKHKAITQHTTKAAQ